MKKDNKKDLVTLKPKKGLVVLDMLGRQIPEKGITTKVNGYYSRLVKAGDLIPETKKGA